MNNAVILAGGQGKRMRAPIPKPMFRVLGEPMLEWVLSACEKAGLTVNFDGIRKSRCEIGDYAFVGCNNNLIAPVSLGKYSYTAAGATITTDVPDYALAIDRGTLHIKEGYTLRKFAKKKKD